MKAEAADYLAKGRATLADARRIAGLPLPHVAAREAYLAMLHAAEVLGGLAEFERELIRVRTGEGRARAVVRGVKLGRKPKLTQHQQKEALRRRDAGEPYLNSLTQAPLLRVHRDDRLAGAPQGRRFRLRVTRISRFVRCVFAAVPILFFRFGCSGSGPY